MSRIDDDLLDCVIYLYASKEEAEVGINIGGSGFLVSYPSSRGIKAGGFMYAVTNRHVIRAKCSTVRLNTSDGKTDVFEYSPSAWTCSDTDDLAVKVLPGSISGTIYRFRTVSQNMLLTKKLVEDFDIGVGERSRHDRAIYQYRRQATEYSNRKIWAYCTNAFRTNCIRRSGYPI